MRTSHLNSTGIPNWCWLWPSGTLQPQATWAQPPRRKCPQATLQRTSWRTKYVNLVDYEVKWLTVKKVSGITSIVIDSWFCILIIFLVYPWKVEDFYQSTHSPWVTNKVYRYVHLMSPQATLCSAAMTTLLAGKSVALPSTIGSCLMPQGKLSNPRATSCLQTMTNLLQAASGDPEATTETTPAPG